AVTDVTQVIYFAVLAEARFLEFDEIAYPGAGIELGTRSDSGKGSDVAALTDDGLADDSIGMNDRAGPDVAVAQDAVGSDAHAIAKSHLADEDYIDVDFDIPAGFKLATHVDPCRVAQSDALLHQLTGD